MADVLYLGLVLSLQTTSWSNSILCLHTTKTHVELVLERINHGQSVRPSLAIIVRICSCLSLTEHPKAAGHTVNWQ